MSIARWSIQRPVNTWLIVLACLFGGIYGLMSIGRLEDPAFTIKQAKVVTPYPGASAVEVENQVTERLESAIQQLGQLKEITSVSKPGRSEITVEIQSKYDSSEIPQIWDELRRKVNDAQSQLPSGVGPSVVNDDFGDVFGLFYAVTAPGFSSREVKEIVKSIRRELLSVPGVAKVVMAGSIDQRIHIDLSQDRMRQLGISLNDVANVLDAENMVQANGSVRIGEKRIRLSIDDAFHSVDSFDGLLIGVAGSTAMVRLDDIATVSLGEQDPPEQIIRYDGQDAMTLAVSAAANTNIVEVGKAVATKLAALESGLPLGVELHPIYNQAAVVDEAVGGFILNVGLSVAIVIGVLCLFMGWRAGVVIGTVLLLTVTGTVLLMWLSGIELQRISLGALIIAMGMLVDNAIVVAEGMLIGMHRGRSALDAAVAVVRQTQWPLLGATVIGLMAFSGIGLSNDTTGEFLFSLFAVISISLLLSWVLAITVTPLFGNYFFKRRAGSEDSDPYAGILYRGYRGILSGALRVRWLTVGLLVAVTAASVYGFGFVKQSFFPNSNTPIFYVNFWLPQGSDIRAVSDDLREAEAFLKNEPDATSVTTLVGAGASRFMLTYAPEAANSAYGQLIVRATNLEVIDPLATRTVDFLRERFPEAEVRVQRLVFGPGNGAKIEARFSGSDADVLRGLAAKAEAAFRADGRIKDIRNDWRQRELVLRPVFDEQRARIAGVTRQDVANTIRLATDGLTVGSYRDGDETIPIVARAAADERGDPSNLPDRLIWSAGQNAYVPAMQIIGETEVRAEDTLIHRRNRVRTVTVMAEPANGETADSARKRIIAAVEAIPVPEGYWMEWGGEYENSRDAKERLGANLPAGFLAMVLITIALFGRIREPLLIWLIVPMSICGVSMGLLGTGMPFGFTSLIGFLSLSGMLIKNAIVLVDEIDVQIAAGQERHQAVVAASVSRLRPVVLAAGTTILGMIPLLADAFFASMAVTIMGGLAFATVLTLVAVPTLYSLFFGIRYGGSRD